MMGRSDPTVTSQSVLCSDSPVFQWPFLRFVEWKDSMDVKGSS